jgi:hypothetical protein
MHLPTDSGPESPRRRMAHRKRMQPSSGTSLSTFATSVTGRPRLSAQEQPTMPPAWGLCLGSLPDGGRRSRSRNGQNSLSRTQPRPATSRCSAQMALSCSPRACPCWSKAKWPWSSRRPAPMPQMLWSTLSALRQGPRASSCSGRCALTADGPSSIPPHPSTGPRCAMWHPPTSSNPAPSKSSRWPPGAPGSSLPAGWPRSSRLQSAGSGPRPAGCGPLRYPGVHVPWGGGRGHGERQPG